MTVDLGRDAETLAANITGGPGWRARVNAWAEALFGSGSPFGTAAFVDSGTAAGNVVVTGDDKRIPGSVIPPGAGPTGLRAVQILQPEGNPERFLKADSLRLSVRNVSGVLRCELGFEQVAAEYAAPASDPEAKRTISGVDGSFAIRVGEEYDDEVFTSPGGATLTAVSSAPGIASVEVLGPTRLADGRDRWVLRHTGVAPGSTTGAVRASWPGEDAADHYGVRVARRATDPLPGLRITGLQLSPGLRVGGSRVVDNFRVSPVDAIVSLEKEPDELIAQGVLSGNAFDGQGRGSVTWAAVGAGYTEAVIRAARRTDPTDYVEQSVQLWVEDRGSRRPSISGLVSTMAFAVNGDPQADDFTAGPDITRVSVVSSDSSVAIGLAVRQQGDAWRVGVEPRGRGACSLTVTAYNRAGSARATIYVSVAQDGTPDPGPGDNV